MMKQVIKCFFIFIFSIVIVKPLGVSANDGLLQIKTDINRGKETKEIYYIEQESDLLTIFNPEVMAQVNQRQEQVSKEDIAFKEGIFLEELPQYNWAKDYQQLLFNPETELAVASDYGVQLTQKKTSLPIGMVALFVLGFGVMTWSIAQTRRRKGS